MRAESKIGWTERNFATNLLLTGLAYHAGLELAYHATGAYLSAFKTVRTGSTPGIMEPTSGARLFPDLRVSSTTAPFSVGERASPRATLQTQYRPQFQMKPGEQLGQ